MHRSLTWRSEVATVVDRSRSSTGGGIRVPARGLPLFERVINAVHRGAPGTPIAFNISPSDTADAASRWLVSA